MPEHVQVPLPSLPAVHVDAGMLTLCEFLNARGWTTASSCEGQPGASAGDPGCPYVSFSPVAGMEPATAALAPLALEAGDAQLAARVLGVYTARLGAGRAWVQTVGRPWRYELAWFRQPDWDPDVEHGLAATIRLDHDDLLKVTRLLEGGKRHAR